MFNNKENDYFNAIKHAQVYSSTETKVSNKKLLIFNFIFLAFLGYVLFSYLESNDNTFTLPISEQVVLGISKTIDESTELSDERLMEILNSTEVDSVEDLANSMKVLMSEPTIKSKSSYTEAIARELDEKSGF